MEEGGVGRCLCEPRNFGLRVHRDIGFAHFMDALTKLSVFAMFILRIALEKEVPGGMELS